MITINQVRIDKWIIKRSKTILIEVLSCFYYQVFSFGYFTDQMRYIIFPIKFIFCNNGDFNNYTVSQNLESWEYKSEFISINISYIVILLTTNQCYLPDID